MVALRVCPGRRPGCEFSVGYRYVALVHQHRGVPRFGALGRVTGEITRSLQPERGEFRMPTGEVPIWGGLEISLEMFYETIHQHFVVADIVGLVCVGADFFSLTGCILC